MVTSAVTDPWVPGVEKTAKGRDKEKTEEREQKYEQERRRERKWEGKRDSRSE